MLTFDTTTMILCAVLIVMSIVSPMMNVFFRKIKKTPSDSVLQGELPPVSILLTVHDNARDLERHLPSLLAQDYPAGYEVIIVVEKGEDDTDDVLSHFTANHQNMYVTFVPDSSRYMSRKKLAVTLGVKAAKNQWILMAEPTCEPASDQWLKNIAQFADDNHDMVTGYANYNEDATDYQRFERMMTECYLTWKAHNTVQPIVQNQDASCSAKTCSWMDVDMKAILSIFAENTISSLTNMLRKVEQQPLPCPSVAPLKMHQIKSNGGTVIYSTWRHVST